MSSYTMHIEGLRADERDAALIRDAMADEVLEHDEFGEIASVEVDDERATIHVRDAHREVAERLDGKVYQGVHQ